MNIDKLKYFVDSAELESFSAAADKNFVSQTAISKQIHGLEKEMNTQLFTIANNKIKLTPAGNFFYSKAKLLISDFSSAVDQTEQIGQTTVDTLRVGFTTSFEALMADKILTEFKKANPQVKIFPIQQTYQQSSEGLLNQTLDVIFAVDYGIGRLTEEKVIDKTVVKEGQMKLGIGKTHPLASKSILGGHEIADETIGFYNFDGSTPAPLGMRSNAQKDGYVLEKIKRFDRLEGLLLDVSLNNCITFVPEGFSYPSNPNISYREIENTSHRYKIYVATNQRNTNPSVSNFAKMVNKLD